MKGSLTWLWSWIHRRHPPPPPPPPTGIRIRIGCWIQIRMNSPRTTLCYSSVREKIILNIFNLGIQTQTTFLAGRGSGKINADLDK
jgi:hypothetical protein